jgi:anti-anti-sigma factor
MSYAIAFGTFDGLPVVCLHGEIDGAACPELEERLMSVARAQGSRVILDLSAVSYMESRPFGTILVLHRRLGEADGGLALVVPEGNLRRLFRASGLDLNLALFADIGAASAHLGHLAAHMKGA